MSSGEFYKIMKDFVSDIVITFPEYKPIIEKWWKFSDFAEIDDAVEREQQKKEKELFLYKHSVSVFTERFFDILSKNDTIFEESSSVNTEFLPGISFKYLWNCDISEKTRETIWKYLQLIVLSIVNQAKTDESSNDNDENVEKNDSKIFDSINDEEFKKKLQETIENMQTLFEQSVPQEENTNQEESSRERGESSNPAESMQDHIHSMMGGKLGEIAKEIAEETANNFNIDMNNPTDINGILSGLLKNPSKLMSMVKDIGGKLDEKMKAGDINEGELFNEASEIMQKMKNIPGMDNIQSMLGKMGIPTPPNMGAGAGSGKNTRVDENAMNRQLQMMKTRERMRKNVEVKAAQQQQQMAQSLLLGSTSVPVYNDEELISMFSEKSVERNAPSSSSSEKKAKKEKKKK